MDILRDISNELEKMDQQGVIKPVLYKILYNIIQPFRVGIIVFIILIVLLVVTQIFSIYRINQLHQSLYRQ